MRFLAAGLLFLLVLIGLELHWRPWQFVTGAFGPRRFVVEGPGGEYGVLSYDLAHLLNLKRKRWIPRVERMLVTAGPLGTVHAAHVVSVGAASVAAGSVLIAACPRRGFPRS